MYTARLLLSAAKQVCATSWFLYLYVTHCVLLTRKMVSLKRLTVFLSGKIIAMARFHSLNHDPLCSLLGSHELQKMVSGSVPVELGSW